MNDFDALLYPHMKKRLLTYHDDYFSASERYDITDEAPLHLRYADLQLRDTSELRLSQQCPAEAPGTTAAGMAMHPR